MSTARICADGRCASERPAVLSLDGTTELPASSVPPNYVPAGAKICDTCLLARLNLQAEVTSVDPRGICEVLEEDAVGEAFGHLELDTGGLDALVGRYAPEDYLYMTRYLDVDDVLALARSLDAER